jgi:hypothetical protein
VAIVDPVVAMVGGGSGLSGAGAYVRSSPVSRLHGPALGGLLSATRGDLSRCSKLSKLLLDHLVGEREEIVGDFDAKRLGGFEVDHQLELG